MRSFARGTKAAFMKNRARECMKRTFVPTWENGMPGRIRGSKPDKIKKRKKKKIPVDQIEQKVKKLRQTKPVKEHQTIPRRKARRRPKRKWSLKDLDLKNSISLEKVKQLGIGLMHVAVVLLCAFVFVWYFGQRVSTVGDSMNPVLKNGDVVLVNRFIYNTSSPKRGDIIVFKPKGNENSHYYIKRIIGLPGETVEIIEGRIYIDGERLEEDYTATEISDVGIVTEKMELDGDEYFVLGDDRGKSEDSRMADVGNVKRVHIYGKAWFAVSPLEHFGFVKDK